MRIYPAPRFLLPAALALALPHASRAAAPPPAGAATRPNILMVLIDDMGWSDLSCFNGKHVVTEHVDRLAAEGIRFERFYVNSPICSPSRTALTTGQYPQRWRIGSYLADRRHNEARGIAQWLDPGAPVLARELHKAGYATGHFGKWHMGGQRDVGDAPLITAYGFDRSLTNFEGLGPRVLPLCDAYNGKPPRKHDLGSANLGHGPIRWDDRSVITTRFAEEAIRFIDEALAAGKPFYINLWPDDVHSPYFPPKALRQATDESKRALYYAVLDAMDQQFAAIFDRIRTDTRLRGNTLVVLCSDNGPEEGAGLATPLRRGKTWLYEGGIRSSLVVWGPGLLAPGTAGTVNRTSTFCALDLNRSFYTVAGVPPPAGVTLDGEDLANTLLGKSTAGRRAPIFFRRPPDRPGSKDEDNPDLAVRDGKWKFTVNYDGSTPQLYNLEDDVSESRNVAREHPEVAAHLKQALLAWNATLPADAGDPARQPADGESLPYDRFVNPIGEGADPWVVRDEAADRYLWCQSEGNRAIAVYTSERLTSLGRKHTVWRAPANGPCSREVWAPELHRLDDRWYIYFAASDGHNQNHRAYVLCSRSPDPLGPYELHGPLATGDGADGRSPALWAIDMTVLEHADRRYAIWSGWDAPDTDRQYLYIAPMPSPAELSGPRVRLCANDDYPWERTEPGDRGRGLNEAPEVLRADSRTFIVYSCGASWLPSYKLGLLELSGRDPLDPHAWKKHDKPVFEGTDGTYGVGHSCFVRSPDGTEWWHVFHAKRDRAPGWRRALYVQPMGFNTGGEPVFGPPVAAETPLACPSGESKGRVVLPFDAPLKTDAFPENWQYLGHHQFVRPAMDGLHLGCVPEAPINDYRCGEKLVLDGVLPADVSAEVTIDFRGDATARDAGLLFRVTGASIGYDAQRGYFAGLIPKTGLLVIGRTDGKRWLELAKAEAAIDAAKPQRLRVEAKGNQLAVSVNGRQRLVVTDDTYPVGTVGLRVVDTHAVFSDVAIR